MVTQVDVLILCFNRLLRESVARILNKRTDFHVTASHPPRPIRVANSCTPPRTWLYSIHCSCSVTSKSLFGPRERRLIKCVLVAMQDDQKLFLSAIRQGALGYVLQETFCRRVVNSVRTVAQGEAVCPSQTLGSFLTISLYRRHQRPTAGSTRKCV